MKRFFLIVMVLVFFSTAAIANENYAGFEVASITYEETGFPDVKPTVFRARLGRSVTPYFAVEGHLGTGISDDTITVLGIGLNLEIDSLFGIYARGIAPVSDIFRVYGLAGFTRIDATFSAPGFGISISDDESDISYGLGAELLINETVSGSIEYINLIDKKDFAFSSFGIGVKISF